MTVRRNRSVRWNDSHRITIANYAALAMLDEGEKFYGRAIITAQQHLPAESHMAESSILNQQCTKMKPWIDARIVELRAERAARLSEPVATPATPVAVEKSVSAPASQFAERMEALVESVVEIFGSQLRQRLMEEAPLVLKEMAEIIRQEEGTAVISKEVSAFSAIPRNAVEVKATKIKVAILGGNGKGGDKHVISQGLEEVYDLKFIDTDKSVAEEVKNCDFVVVRTRYSSHGMQHSAEQVLGKSKVIKCPGGSPQAVNDYLVSHYAGL